MVATAAMRPSGDDYLRALERAARQHVDHAIRRHRDGVRKRG